MTLDEAIQHCEEKALCGDACGLEHKQLADWLKELKSYRMDEENKLDKTTVTKVLEHMLNTPKFDLEKFRKANDLGDFYVDYSGIDNGKRYKGRKYVDTENDAEKEYGCKSYLYGMVRDYYAPETGYIVMSKKKHFTDMKEDDFGYRLDVETDNPDITFHYYRPKKDFNYSDAETTIAKEYKLDRDNLLKLYVYNYNVAGDVAFIELKNWNVVPGCAYSKRH